MTPNQITTLIATNFDRELDMPFKLQLMERVKYWRSTLLSRSLEKDPSKRRYFRQTLYMKLTPALNVPCATPVACPVAITEELPQMVKTGIMFDYVGGIDGKSPFKEVSPGTGGYLSQGGFASQFPQYELVNNRISTSKADLPMIRVDGVFDDPMAVMEFSCAQAGQPCDTWNTEFPCSGDILQLIVQSILQIDYNRPERQESEEIK
jgi:hypothetical protein